ncbi:four-carbon acid sugar kinase family protein [soil metagenome]
MTRPFLGFYGDDLTGSTDAMEALAARGVPARLFLDPPDADDLKSSEPLAAVGIAGTSRAQSPGWMRANLPSAFQSLAALGVPLIHYKVCSTFDSAPTIGNIGTVLDIGLELFGRAVPIVAGVPELNRFTAFGTLFASFIDGQVYRIDRHPVMSRHPTTPMGEADLVKHLAAQTKTPVDLIDFRVEDIAARYDAAAKRGVLIDNLNPVTALAIGKFLRTLGAPGKPAFVIGSSGVEYALLAAMRTYEKRAERSLSRPALAVERLLVLSGSASPTTARQIAAAVGAGFTLVKADIAKLAAGSDDEVRRLAEAATAALGKSSVIIATAVNPGDVQGSIDASEAGKSLGKAGALILDRLPQIGRVVVAGGDTSSFVARALGVHALELETEFDRGAPLCRATLKSRHMQILFKGGQLGHEDLFDRVRQGTAAKAAAA